MISRRLFMGMLLGAAGLAVLPGRGMADVINFNFLKKKGADFPYKLTDDQWLSKLGQQSFLIMRQGENETAGTSPLLKERRKGTYCCKGCGQPLFSSYMKTLASDFPTFKQPLNVKALGTSADFGIILPRTEVHCKNCGSHLGYKFLVDDAAAETWRYPMNGAALSFLLAKA